MSRLKFNRFHAIRCISKSRTLNSFIFSSISAISEFVYKVKFNWFCIYRRKPQAFGLQLGLQFESESWPNRFAPSSGQRCQTPMRESDKWHLFVPLANPSATFAYHINISFEASCFEELLKVLYTASISRGGGYRRMRKIDKMRIVVSSGDSERISIKSSPFDPCIQQSTSDKVWKLKKLENLVVFGVNLQESFGRHAIKPHKVHVFVKRWPI